ncbi:MAG TPA: ankyrin repeat domain-containing protein [Salinarimonas sp.]|nr:ankyrin repeat domain-containing protein [Salinarimonas sp.]
MCHRPGIGLAATLLAALAAGTGARAQSVDCRRPAGAAQEILCADAGLAALDRELAEIVRRRAAALPPGRAREAWLADQRRWSAGRADACPEPVPAVATRARAQLARCLEALAAQRIAVLTLEANEARWPKLPFRPALREGAGRPLCEALARDAVASFLGPAVAVSPLGEREIGFRSVALGGPSRGNQAPPAIALVDPYHEGQAAAVLRIEGTRPGTWTYRVFPSEDALRRAFRLSPTGSTNPFAVGGDRDLSTPLLDRDRLREAGRHPDLDSGGDLPIREAPRLFKDAGRVHVLIPARDGATRSQLAGIYTLSGPAKIERLCLIEIEREPEEDGLPGDLPEVETLRQVANAVLPPPSCAPATEDEETLDRRAATRPWSLRLAPSAGPLPRPVGTDELRLYLRRKGQTSIEARRGVQALEAAYAEAEARLAALYRDAFSPTEPEARALARLVLDRKLGTGIALDEEGPVRRFLAPDFEARHAPHRAALSGDAAALWAGLGREPKVAITAAQGDLDEPLLSLALEHPGLVSGLLARGADPNAYGASGFTPLMTAARLGLVEAARLLLAAGADADLPSRPARFEPRVLDGARCGGGDPAAEAGLTALALAEGAGSAEIVELLASVGDSRPAPR